MRNFIIIAARNLIKNKTRSLILASAITLVTMLLVIFMAIAAGIQHTILTNAMALASGHVNIAGFYKISQSSSAPMVTKSRELRSIAEREIPEASLIIDRIKCWGKIISDTGSVMVPMWGVDLKTEKDLLGRLRVVEGNLNDLENRGTIVVFEIQAKKLGVKAGDGVTISMPTSRNTSNTKDLRVAAILQDVGLMSNFSVFLHKEDARDIYQMSDNTTGQIMIFLKNPNDIKIIEERLRKSLTDKGFVLMTKESLPFWMKFDRVSGESWTGQKIDITNWKDETSFMKWVLDVFNALMLVMTVVLMIIVVIGMINALWMSIRERISEIGTLRAIGLQRRQVMLMFLLEGVLLSVVATLTGIFLGTLVSLILGGLDIPIQSDAIRMFLASNTLTLVIRPQSLLVVFLSITILLSLGALYPARIAGKMKPITAINKIT